MERTSPTSNTRPNIMRPIISRNGGLVWEVEPGKHCTTFPTVAIVDPPNDIGLDKPTEPYARRHPVALKSDVLVITENLPCIQKRRNLKIRCYPRDFCPYQMNSLFD